MHGLRKAVRDQIISAGDAELIQRTRIDGISLKVWAHHVGLTVSALTMRRLRAEACLRAMLAG